MESYPSLPGVGLGGERDGDRSTGSGTEVREQGRCGHRASSANLLSKRFHSAMALFHVTEDITFNNLLPLYNSKLLKAYASLDDRVARLGRLVKFWAKSRNLGSRRSRFGCRPLPKGNTVHRTVRFRLNPSNHCSGLE